MLFGSQDVAFVSLALSLVLVLRFARLPVPWLIPVLEFLWHAPAVWVDKHQTCWISRKEHAWLWQQIVLNGRRGQKRD